MSSRGKHEKSARYTQHTFFKLGSINIQHCFFLAKSQFIAINQGPILFLGDSFMSKVLSTSIVWNTWSLGTMTIQFMLYWCFGFVVGFIIAYGAFLNSPPPPHNSFINGTSYLSKRQILHHEWKCWEKERQREIREAAHTVLSMYSSVHVYIVYCTIFAKRKSYTYPINYTNEMFCDGNIAMVFLKCYLQKTGGSPMDFKL